MMWAMETLTHAGGNLNGPILLDHDLAFCSMVEGMHIQ